MVNYKLFKLHSQTTLLPQPDHHLLRQNTFYCFPNGKTSCRIVIGLHTRKTVAQQPDYPKAGISKYVFTKPIYQGLPVAAILPRYDFVSCPQKVNHLIKYICTFFIILHRFLIYLLSNIQNSKWKIKKISLLNCRITHFGN